MSDLECGNNICDYVFHFSSILENLNVIDIYERYLSPDSNFYSQALCSHLESLTQKDS